MSSTTSTRSPRRSARTTARAAAPSGRFASRAVNQNVLPRPSSLSTPMAPPIISASCLEIASPSPVPPYFRVVELSACENDSNSRARASGAMPIPVSATSKRISAVSAVSATRVTRTTTSPRSVNFTALPTRLVRICRSRAGSPRSTAGMSW